MGTLPDSPFRAVLNNRLVHDIEADRDKLEHCAAEDLPRLQAEILVRRQLIGFLARKDKR